jgi:hypothetical protein
MARQPKTAPPDHRIERRIETKTAVDRVIQQIEQLIHLEPTCIKCGCTEFHPCPEGCAWVFVNKRLEGLCSACFQTLIGS